ncbi:MAG: hypothetical protein GY754_17960 [bacterium]|nr:hypothetical protein [bacterium]
MFILKSKRTVLLLFTIAVTASVAGCNTTKNRMGNSELSLCTDGKWLSPHAYVISVSVGPGEQGEGKLRVRRRILAREAARRLAIQCILIRFKGERPPRTSIDEPYPFAIAGVVKAHIISGDIEKMLYNENDECRIIYKVEAKDLRKKNRQIPY